jgi:hypothetical protein
MQFIAWLIVCLVLSMVGEFLMEITHVVNSDKELRPVAVVWFVFLGLVAGFVTGAIAPDRVLAPGPFSGVSLLLVPSVVALCMTLVGWSRGTKRSHLASWYGGAALGFGLAAGRLIALAFVAEVRSV